MRCRDIMNMGTIMVRSDMTCQEMIRRNNAVNLQPGYSSLEWVTGSGFCSHHPPHFEIWIKHFRKAQHWRGASSI